MVFDTAFNNISAIYRGHQFYWWRKMEYQEKTTSLPSLTNLSHNVVSSTPRHKQDSNSQF